MRDSRNDWSRREGLAQKIEPQSTWTDIALPERQLRALRELAVFAARFWQVSEDRQPEVTNTPSQTVALFSGADRAGKIVAAEVLARELHLELYRIDLTRVVSTYIRETEKNLSHIFTEASASNAILFFDEADALFGKRTEVKDSHDRSANIEISYFLQRLEEYGRLVILAAESPHEWTPCLQQRIGSVVDFPSSNPV